MRCSGKSQERCALIATNPIHLPFRGAPWLMVRGSWADPGQKTLSTTQKLRNLWSGRRSYGECRMNSILVILAFVVGAGVFTPPQMPQTPPQYGRQHRLDWSVRTGVDQTKIRVEPAAETKNRAQFSRQTPKPRHNPLRWLDKGAKQLQH